MPKETVFAILVTTRKLLKLNISSIKSYLKRPLIILTPENANILLQDLVNSGKHVILLHKIGDFKSKTHETEYDLDGEITLGITSLTSIPGIKWLDDPQKGALLASRIVMYDLLRDFCTIVNREKWGVTFDVPDTHFYDNAINALPSILKPICASGEAGCHDMIYLPANTEYMVEHSKAAAYVRQGFIPHSPRVIYKVYIIGKHVSIVPQHGISEDCTCSGEICFFSSSKLKSGEWPATLSAKAMHKIQTYHDSIVDMALRLSAFCSIKLLGIDIILGENNGYFYLVDLNYFPGYDGVEDVPFHLAQLLLDEV